MSTRMSSYTIGGAIEIGGPMFVSAAGERRSLSHEYRLRRRICAAPAFGPGNAVRGEILMTQPGGGFVALARPSGSSSRVFPAIDADLYQSSRPDNLSAQQQAALKFLHQARHHRKAFEAELAGHWRRADFYWCEFIAGLSRPAHGPSAPARSVCR